MTTEQPQFARAKTDRGKTDMAGTRESAVREAAVPETRAEREAIMEAAMAGDKKQEARALACIRAFPGEYVVGWGDPINPCLSMLCLQEKTTRARVFRARVEQEYTLNLKQIAGDNPTPLEQLLAERITVLRFQLTNYERQYECALQKGMALSQSEHQMKRLDRLGKEYVRAIESLAKVRRLQLPILVVGQVNIGDKQVNVGAGMEAVQSTTRT